MPALRRIVGFAVGVSVASAAPAATWTFFAQCGDAGQMRAYSFDSGSVTSKRGKVLVKVNADYSHDAGNRARDGALLWSIDCAGRTYFEKSRVEYRANRSVVAKYRAPTIVMPIMANSVADKLATKVCTAT
jgi:hypothetical protein